MQLQVGTYILVAVGLGVVVTQLGQMIQIG